MSIKETLLLFLLFIGLPGLHGQAVTIENVLATSATDEKVMRDEEMERFTQSLNYKLPPIRKVDVRLGFNGNNTPDSLDGTLRNEDYYSVNVTTNRWKEMKLQKAIKPVQTNVYSKEKELFRIQALQDRCLVVSTLYYSTESLKKKKELHDLLTRKNELLQQLLSNGISIKISDALDTERDLVQVLGLMQEDENSISVCSARLKQFFNTTSDVSVNFRGLVSIQKIMEINAALQRDTTSQHPSLAYKDAQYRFASANYLLERAQNINFVNSFQVGYNRPVYTPQILNKFNPDNTVTFRLGLSIPIAGSYNLNRNNANIERYDALMSLNSTRAIQGKQISTQQQRLDNSIRQYNNLNDIYTRSVVSKLLSNEKILAQSTALEILDMNIARKKMEISLLASAGTLMQNYIILLENKGLLLYELRYRYLIEN